MNTQYHCRKCACAVQPTQSQIRKHDVLCLPCKRAYNAKWRLSRGIRPRPGLSNTPTYIVWSNIKARCLRPQSGSYKNYGGRGIRLCDRWLNYANFLADMGERPAGKQIDRIDNNGHYEPGNCRWVSRIENQRNRRVSRLYTAFGETKTINEWSRLTGVARDTIKLRASLGYPPGLVLARLTWYEARGLPNPDGPRSIARSEGN